MAFEGFTSGLRDKSGFPDKRSCAENFNAAIGHPLEASALHDGPFNADTIVPYGSKNPSLNQWIRDRAGRVTEVAGRMTANYGIDATKKEPEYLCLDDSIWQFDMPLQAGQARTLTHKILDENGLLQVTKIPNGKLTIETQAEGGSGNIEVNVFDERGQLLKYEGALRAVTVSPRKQKIFNQIINGQT